MSTQAERLARVEEQVKALTDKVEDHRKDADERFDKIDQKLDELIAIRNKGAGLIWLLGTGFIGGVYAFIDLIFSGYCSTG